MCWPLGDQATLRTRILVPFERSDLFAGLRIPQLDGIVPRAGAESSAVGRPGNAIRLSLVCPLSSRSTRPLAASHSRTVLSSEQDARIFPSGDQATPLTMPPCPSRIRICRPVAASHRHTSLVMLDARCQRRAIRRPANADNTRLMLKRLQDPPALHIPKPDGLVLRRRRQGAAVGRQGHPVNLACMSPQRMAELQGGMRAVLPDEGRLLLRLFSSGAILFSPAVSMRSAICILRSDEYFSGRDFLHRIIGQARDEIF